MAESGASSPEPPVTDPVVLEELLDQDEEDLRGAPNRTNPFVTSHGSEDLQNEDEGTDEEDSAEAEAEAQAENFYQSLVDEDEDPEARPPSPQASPNPYVHPPISDRELDFDWDEDQEIPEAVKAKRRKRAGKLACVGLSSTASNAEIKWCLKYYNLGCLWARPHPEMRPHIFDYNPRLRIPRMVLTPKLVRLGIGFPLHPYFRSILEWFDIAPIQLSPNSWKLAIALYMLYQDHNQRAPTMMDLSYFFRLGASSVGYFYLVVRRSHNSTGWSEGKTSNEKKWKEPFFYLWPEYDRVRTQFNLTPSKILL